MKEFLRVLTPDGLLIFQIINEPKSLRDRLRKFALHTMPTLVELYRKARFGNRPTMEVYGMRPRIVIRFLEEVGARLIRVEKIPSAGPDAFGVEMWRYCAKK